MIPWKYPFDITLVLPCRVFIHTLAGVILWIAFADLGGTHKTLLSRHQLCLDAQV